MKALECTLAVPLIILLAITNALNIPSSNNEPPKIIEGPLHTVAITGSSVILKCLASGYPKPQIIWEANGNKILPMPMIGSRYEILPSGDLKIQEVYFFESGEYSCTAVNSYGKVKESARLDVKEKTQIFRESHIKKVSVGQTAMFRCQERHDESLSIEIEWLKDGQIINYDNEDKYSKLSDNSLAVFKTVGLDSGEYTCVARTDVDEDRALTTLVVEDAPNPPMIEDVICVGRRAEITWKPQGDNRSPILSYSVYYNTSFAPENWEEGEARVHSSNLQYTYFMNPWVSYSFRVIAHNRVGLSHPSKKSKTCTTQPDVPYKNPENVKTEPNDPTNLVIKWTPMPEINHNGPNLHYRVFWKRDIPNSDWKSKDILDWKENKVIISGQPMFVKYLVKVVAINEMGISKVPAEEVVGYSGEDRPLLAPTKFKMLDLESSTSALLKWDPISPESLRGQFMGYKLQTWTADEGEELLREVRIANDMNEVLFTQLKPYSKNFVRLCAYNSRFDGPSTVISFDTPEGRPSSVQNLEAYVLSLSDVLLTWDKPLQSNGRLTGYKIYYQEIRHSNVADRQDSYLFLDDPLVTSAKLGYLRPNTNYRITVVAKTAMGEGEEIKGQPEWHDAPHEKHNDYQIIGGLARDSVYEFRVVSVDKNYQKESEFEEIKTL